MSEEKITEQDQEVFDMVNRGKDTSAADAIGEAYAAAQEKAASPRESERTAIVGSPANCKNEPRNHRQRRIRAFWTQVLEPAIGYIALGGVMVAGMVLGIVPAFAAIPVFSFCFIWVAIRADRFLREV